MANSGLHDLPASLQATRLRWHGVAFDARITVHPETVTARAMLSELNAERRRVLLARMGYDDPHAYHPIAET